MMTDYLKAEDSDKESDTEEAELTNPSPLDDKPTEPHQALAAFDYESDTMMSLWMQRMKGTMIGWTRRCLKVTIEEVWVKMMEEPTTRKHPRSLSISQDKSGKIWTYLY